MGSNGGSLANKSSLSKNAKPVKNYLASVQNYFQRLELAIKSKGESKGSLAVHLGIALSTLSRWRKAMPRAETINQTANFLGVSAKWLLSGEGPMVDSKAEIQIAESEGDLNDRKMDGAKKLDISDHAERIAALETELRIVKQALASLLPRSGRGGNDIDSR